MTEQPNDNSTSANIYERSNYFNYYPTFDCLSYHHTPSNINDLNTLELINDVSPNHLSFKIPNMINYFKIGTLNIQQVYRKKIYDIISFCSIHNYNILSLMETG